MSLEEKAVSIHDVYVIVCEYMRQGKPVPNKQVVGLEEAKQNEEELKTIANAAHDNAQWMMDANKRQVERVKRLIAYLDELDKAEQQNYEVGAAMATNAENRDCIMARAKGRLDMSKRLRELIFPSTNANQKSSNEVIKK